jgi:hypothetical protein
MSSANAGRDDVVIITIPVIIAIVLFRECLPFANACRVIRRLASVWPAFDQYREKWKWFPTVSTPSAPHVFSLPAACCPVFGQHSTSI